MGWRPRGYENPFRKVFDWRGDDIEEGLRHCDFEAGADAMLEALKTEYMTYRVQGGEKVVHFASLLPKGWLVLIKEVVDGQQGAAKE